MNSAGELLVTSGSSESGTAECAIVDPYSARNETTHTWVFGQPASFSAFDDFTSYADSVRIESVPSLLVTNLLVSLSPSQNGVVGTSTDFNLGSTSSVDSVSLSGVSPGNFMIHVNAISEGMLDWIVVFDMGLEKTNTPPIIEVYTDEIEGTQETWNADYSSFSLSGKAWDPDGGDVSMSATMCGETGTGFTKTGDEWIVSLSTARCIADGETEFDVTITVIDSAGSEAWVDVNVPSPYNDDTSDDETTTKDKDEESGLPSIGMFATLVSMLGAALLLRRD